MAEQKRGVANEVLEQLKVIGEASEEIAKAVTKKAITKGLPALNKGLKNVAKKLKDWVEGE